MNDANEVTYAAKQAGLVPANIKSWQRQAVHLIEKQSLHTFKRIKNNTKGLKANIKSNEITGKLRAEVRGESPGFICVLPTDVHQSVIGKGQGVADEDIAIIIGKSIIDRDIAQKIQYYPANYTKEVSKIICIGRKCLIKKNATINRYSWQPIVY